MDYVKGLTALGIVVIIIIMTIIDVDLFGYALVFVLMVGAIGGYLFDDGETDNRSGYDAGTGQDG